MNSKIKLLVLAALFSVSSVLAAASQSDGSNKGDVTDGKNNTGDIHNMCWQGSNSGNQHDKNTDTWVLKDKNGNAVLDKDGNQVICAPKTGSNGRPPKHCTHTNKHGMKHKESASGC